MSLIWPKILKGSEESKEYSFARDIDHQIIQQINREGDRERKKSYIE